MATVPRDFLNQKSVWGEGAIFQFASGQFDHCFKGPDVGVGNVRNTSGGAADGNESKPHQTMVG